MIPTCIHFILTAPKRPKTLRRAKRSEREEDDTSGNEDVNPQAQSARGEETPPEWTPPPEESSESGVSELQQSPPPKKSKSFTRPSQSQSKAASQSKAPSQSTDEEDPEVQFKELMFPGKLGLATQYVSLHFLHSSMHSSECPSVSKTGKGEPSGRQSVAEKEKEIAFKTVFHV
jgi:hypothetical protein